jgi:RNA polymerase sigma factor (sigma-70 family)
MKSADEDLAARAAAGDDRAFGELFARYQPRLQSYCRSILRNEEDARDAVQTTMLKALVALRASHRSVTVGPWLYRIAHNESVSLLRRRRPVAELTETLGDEHAEPVAGLIAREELRAAIDGIQALPARLQRPLVLSVLGGMSHAQIAQETGTSALDARKRVFEARTVLRRRRVRALPLGAWSVFASGWSSLTAGLGGGSAVVAGSVGGLAVPVKVVAGVAGVAALAVGAAPSHRAPREHAVAAVAQSVATSRRAPAAKPTLRTRDVVRVRVARVSPPAGIVVAHPRRAVVASVVVPHPRRAVVVPSGRTSSVRVPPVQSPAETVPYAGPADTRTPEPRTKRSIASGTNWSSAAASTIPPLTNDAMPCIAANSARPTLSGSPASSRPSC